MKHYCNIFVGIAYTHVADEGGEEKDGTLFAGKWDVRYLVIILNVSEKTL